MLGWRGWRGRGSAVFQYPIRRVLFYSLLVFYMAMSLKFSFLPPKLSFWFWVVHVMYFDLDPYSPHPLAQVLFFLAHSLSFSGSLVMATIAILLEATDSGFVASRANLDHVSVAGAWILNIVTHYLPACILLLDLRLSQSLIAKQYDVWISPWTQTFAGARVLRWRDIAKGIWACLGAVCLCGLWFASGFRVKEAYGADVSYAMVIPVAVTVNATVGLLLMRLVNRWGEDLTDDSMALLGDEY